MPAPPRFDALPVTFYEPSARLVARRLLGHWLVRRTPVGLAGGVIVETEAYLANDPACHAYKRETLRNRVMYGPPGRAYVYFIYGNHFCVNAVCGPPGVGEAVLLRALHPVFGLEWMQTQRAVPTPCELTNGPGKLCAALTIGRDLNGVDLCDVSSPVFIAANQRLRSTRARLGPVQVTPRIGITLAATLPLRFVLARSAFVSRRVTVAALVRAPR